MRTQEWLENEDSVELKEPPKYNVILLNDDYRSMDFVVEILIDIFHHSEIRAIEIMQNIHFNGKGVCGTYSHEIAETKIAQVKKRARESGFPLKAIMEEA